MGRRALDHSVSSFQKARAAPWTSASSRCFRYQTWMPGIVFRFGGLQRTAIAAYSIASTNEPATHFGLGAIDAIDAVEVRWPDGTTERFAGIDVDRAVTLRRGDGS